MSRTLLAINSKGGPVPSTALATYGVIAKSADGGMRDALSVLDQVLSFGAGPVTADRVRAVLGLIPDELYGEMLRLVSKRDAAAGIAVAIPCYAGYNYLVGRVNSIVLDMEKAASDIVSIVTTNGATATTP